MSSVPQANIFLIRDQVGKSQVAEILLRHFYTVAEATSSESLSQVESFLPDLILLNTSKSRSYALTRQIRRSSVLSKIPVILIAHDLDQIESEALEAGISDFLREPVTEVEVIARIRTLIDLRFKGDQRIQVENGEGEILERTEMLERALRGQGVLLNEARDARRVWESTFNAMADAIVITDTVGQITLANSAASDIFRQTPEELLDQSCDALLAEGFACPHKGSLREHNSNGHEILSRMGDRLLNVRASSFIDTNGYTTGFVHVFRDITRERVLERHLIQAERMSLAGLMVSAVAHEAATPLSVISNIAEMLSMDFEPGSPVAGELTKIITQSRRVAEMMRSILDFVRQRPAQFGAINLARLARETLQLLEYELRRAGIQTSIEGDPAAPLVWGDAAQLQQVLLNLVTNAIQAMKNGGRLTVRIAEATGSDGPGRSVLLTIEDTGPGFTPEAMERLFEFFFTTRVVEGGTGLGLAISRQIVEGHGGTIAAENLQGSGARFSVRLPAAISQDSSMQDKHTALIRAGRNVSP